MKQTLGMCCHIIHNYGITRLCNTILNVKFAKGMKA